VASLQKRLGLTKDEDFSEVWLTRGQFGSTFLDKLGLTGINDRSIGAVEVPLEDRRKDF
jgi:hypothetical protein